MQPARNPAPNEARPRWCRPGRSGSWTLLGYPAVLWAVPASRWSLSGPDAANCRLMCSDGRKHETFVMTSAGSADRQGMSVRELILENLLDLRQRVPFKAALVTFKPAGGATDVPFYNYRYANGAVRHAIEEFIPNSPAFRLAANRPDEVLDWEKVPWFRTTVTATQWLIPSGYCQGTAMVLGEGLDGAVGSFHVSITDEGFAAEEVEALLSTRAFLTELARRDIVRRHAGLSPREMEILGYVALGWTNGEIAEKLVVTRRTVATHVEHILRKLKADNRVQAAVIARQVGSGR